MTNRKYTMSLFVVPHLRQLRLPQLGREFEKPARDAAAGNQPL
jgi:hypothetical protein